VLAGIYVLPTSVFREAVDVLVMWLKLVKPTFRVNEISARHYKISVKCLSATKPWLSHLTWLLIGFSSLSLPVSLLICIYVNMLFSDQPHLTKQAEVIFLQSM